MKQGIGFLLLLTVLAALALLPDAKADVGNLEPVEVILVQKADGQILVETDTGSLGKGLTVSSAFEDLEQSALGDVFLDTAEYLLLAGDTADLIPALADFLRPSCGVIRCVGAPDLKDAAEFLGTHRPELTVKDSLAGKRDIPILETRGGRMHLVEE